VNIQYVPATVLLVAHRSGGLAGRVVGPTGLPISGGCVVAHQVVDGKWFSYLAARAELDGSWHVPRLDAGDYVVEAFPSCESGLSWFNLPSGHRETPLQRVSLGAVTQVEFVAATRTDCPAEGNCVSSPVVG
jgi:hypothetical protein